MYIYDNKKELFQWELNQKVVVEDNKVKEVHFTNDMLSKALVVEVYEFDGKRVANIPNEILQHNFDIMAYGFCGESVRETLSINVIGRSKPEDYVYTETELKNFESLEETVFYAIGEQNAQLEEYVDTVKGNEKRIEAIEKELETPKLQSVFKNNTWEQIATAARMGIAQNYWNVGDYKELVFGELTNRVNKPITTGRKIITPYVKDRDKFIKAIMKKGYTPDIATVFQIQFDYRLNGASYVSRWGINANNGKNFDSTQSKDTITEWEEYGLALFNEDYLGEPDNVAFNSVNDITVTNYGIYPVTIIGFNHDKTADKIAYGRDRAGITFQIGANRNVYGDSKVGVFDLYIDGLMLDATHYKAPNNYQGASNWEKCLMREKLQTILDNTEIENYIVPVKKQTSHHWQDAQKWAAYIDTVDKVFLPSEYEYFGEVLYAPAREGEQYELYRDGSSKFMWSQELLDGTLVNDRIHFRSAVASKVNTNKEDSYYNCGMYLTVKSLNPVSVSYAHSFGSGAGYIAPCFCM